MREIISIFIGQAGVQVGNACTELMCREHDINPDGSLGHKIADLDETQSEQTDRKSLSTFFYETSDSKFVPRSIMVDLEPSVIDEVRNGTYGELYHPDNLIHGKEDAANNFARGKYTVGSRIINNLMEKIEKATDSCSGLQGFMIFNSVGGGTGSGFSALLMEELNDRYGKKSKFGFTVFPSPQVSTSVVEPYNAVLSSEPLMEYQDMTIILDNEAIYDVCQKNLDIDMPSYKQLNDVIAQVYSSTTASLRYEGELNVDINEFQTNLVPYPRIHFVLSSYAPLLSKKKASKQSLTVAEITKMAFSENNMMAKCSPRRGKYMACSLNYRGNVKLTECNAAMSKQSKEMQYVEWCPSFFKVGINGSSPVLPTESDIAPVDKAVCMISNNTSISEVFSRADKNFDMMYAKRAFVHWYISEGMEEGEFTDAREKTAMLGEDYNKINKEVEEDEADEN